MIVRDEIKCLALLLKFDGRAHHPEIISEVQRAGRLNARQNSHGREQTRKTKCQTPKSFRYQTPMDGAAPGFIKVWLPCGSDGSVIRILYNERLA
jgi:hypothetical protein